MVIGRCPARTRSVVEVLAGLCPIWRPASEADLSDAVVEPQLACVVFADDLNDESAAHCLIRLRQVLPVLPVFVVIDANDVADAVQAMRLGATAAIELPPCAALLREYVVHALR